MGNGKSGLDFKTLALILVGCCLIMICSVFGIAGVASGTEAVEQETGAGSSVVIEALNIASHLVKPHLDAYDPSDMSPLPIPGLNSQYTTTQAYLTELYQYLANSHVSGYPADNVQCVAFVRAAYHMAGFPLPTDNGGIPDAYQYWGAAANWSGWKRIPNGQGLPAPGDIIVLNQPGQPGHVSIVVSVIPPQKGQTTGSIYIAQGNAGYTYLTKANDPNIPGVDVPAGIPLSVLPYNPTNYKVDSTWSSFTILGFLHDTAMDNSAAASGAPLPVVGAQCMQMPNDLPASPYVKVAWIDAAKYSLCPRYFVNQINQESGFNPNASNPSGALGIAQFEPSTAPTWGLKVGGGVDERRDPIKSLDAGARYMASLYKNFLKSNPPTTAYMKALASYDGATVGSGSNWFNNLPNESYNYIITIMELNIPKRK